MPVDFDPELGEHAWPGEQEATRSIAQAITAKIESTHVRGRGLALRDAHPRAHGCVRALFEVDDPLEPELAHGVFQPGARYPAWIRFSNGASDAFDHDAACFEFLVQPRTSTAMSVEHSMVEWKEGEAPFHKLATITIPKQSFDLPAQHQFCEGLSFSPWHALAEHRPTKCSEASGQSEP